jgi:DNA-binding transcriptional regulator YiaG
MDKKRCTECGNTSFKAAKYGSDFAVGGRRFKVETQAEQCAKCGEFRIHAQAVGGAELAVAAALAEEGPIEGESFRFMRKVLGMRAADLGPVLGVRSETISRWENDASPVDRASWFALASAVLARAHRAALDMDRMRELVERKKRSKATVKLSAIDAGAR